MLVVCQLIVDDGVANRGHRANCFSKDFLLVGVASGVHKQFKDMCVMDFAEEFTPNGEVPDSPP